MMAAVLRPILFSKKILEASITGLNEIQNNQSWCFLPQHLKAQYYLLHDHEKFHHRHPLCTSRHFRRFQSSQRQAFTFPRTTNEGC